MSETDYPAVVTVRNLAHWRISIRPIEHEADRISSPPECWKLVETHRQSLRGWDYPHLNYDEGHRRFGPNWVDNYTDQGRYHEYWRLYQSGQFIHYLALREEDAGFKQRYRDRFLVGAPPVRPGHVEYVMLMYTVTEVMTFAASLASTGRFGNGIHIGMSLRNAVGYSLISTNFAVDVDDGLLCSVPDLERDSEFSATDLIANSPRIALDWSEWFFQRFGWNIQKSPHLASLQAEFLGKRK